MSHHRIAPHSEKSLPDRQFISKNPPRPVAARAERIFTDKLSAGGDLSAGRSFNRETFYGTGDILIKGRYIKSVIIFPRADFSWRRHFNVTPVQLHG